MDNATIGLLIRNIIENTPNVSEILFDSNNTYVPSQYWCFSISIMIVVIILVSISMYWINQERQKMIKAVLDDMEIFKEDLLKPFPEIKDKFYHKKLIVILIEL